MARQIITMLTDDLDGGEADETVTFAIDGVAYSIDLSEKNAKAFRELMDRYRTAGTREGRVTTSATSSAPRRTGVSHPAFQNNRELNQAIREWAGKHNYEISERGRIPQHIVDAYHNSGGNAPQQTLMNVLRAPAAKPADPTPTPPPPPAATFSAPAEEAKPVKATAKSAPAKPAATATKPRRSTPLTRQR